MPISTKNEYTPDNMNIKFIIVLLAFIFVTQKNHAQEIEKKQKLNILPNLSISSEYQNLLLEQRLNNVNGFGRSSYSKFFIQSDLNFNASQFKYFNICLNEGLKQGLAEQHKYDIGVVGEYLGITKNAAAILLGILSLL